MDEKWVNGMRGLKGEKEEKGDIGENMGTDNKIYGPLVL